MNKENILFGIIGVLAGLIIGFWFANSVNRNASAPISSSTISQNSNMPPGHPDISSNNPDSQQSTAAMPEVQAAIDKAKNEPQNFDAQLKAAEVYYQIQQLDQAIEYLKKANQLKPDDYEVLVHLGNAYFDSNNYTEAEKWYSAALAKKADDVNVRTDLGLTYVFREPPNYDKAIEEFNTSLKNDPNHKQTLQNLTYAYTKKGDAEKANATLSRLETLDAANPAIARLREDIQKLQTK